VAPHLQPQGSSTSATLPRRWVRNNGFFPSFSAQIKFPLEGDNLAQAIQAEEKAIAEIVHHLETDGEDVCCILLEPIQGEGGDNHFRPEFWQQLRLIANKYDVLLIADEVRAPHSSRIFTSSILCTRYILSISLYISP
jgi:4-aminobutyrate aminotransferase-like enzyme